MVPLPLRSRRLAWHYWISILRLVAAGIALPITILFSGNSRVLPLVGWGLIIPMDIILVTADLKYDAGFIASFLGQLLCSLPGAAMLLTYFIKIAPAVNSFPVFLVFLLPYLCGVLYSIGISVSLILALRAACLKDPRFVLLHVDVSWLVNGKDLVMGRVDTSTQSNLFGARRPASLSPLVFPTRAQSAQRFRRVGAYFVQVVFRRISPVETRLYAFIRNIFGLLAVLAILVRAVTLIAQAQGEVFKTNTYTEGCSSDWYSLLQSEVSILVRDPANDYKSSMPLNSDAYQLRIQMSDGRGALADCLPSSRYHLESGRGQIERPTCWFAAYLCANTEASTQRIELRDATFNLTLTSLNGSALSTRSYPQIWIVPSLGHDSDVMESPTPWLVPLWRLVPGVHTEAEFTMAKRKFITSSFFRDIIGGAKPSFETVPMFPIVTTRQTSLNNNSVATAILRPNPRFTSTSSAARKDIQDLMINYLPMSITYEIVEDYRSSTALDALGSIGGLLAILQGLHLLLFGRPLFWGIAGTKLINPFGILGSCGSRGFRRRLREHYYTAPGQVEEVRPEDSLRITAFLRDFVVDFGPADYNVNERRTERPIEPRDDDSKLDSIEMGSKTQLLPTLELSTPIRFETRRES